VPYGDRVLTVDEIFEHLAAADQRRYEQTDDAPHEAVSQLAHALQCAALAEHGGAGDALVAAALLHDLGHLLASRDAGEVEDHRHDAIAEQALTGLFGPEVVAPVALHVAAKRYLCAVEASYASGLSPASMHSLARQGGPFSPSDAEAFIARPHAPEAVELRRWDDAAKVPGAETRRLEDYRELLVGLMVPS
jgi:phosphonate degradation associated HDIG domain protein